MDWLSEIMYRYVLIFGFWYFMVFRLMCQNWIWF